MRRLIINADDFGLTRGVNRAIVEAHGHGLVTSATLMAKGLAFDDAVELAKRTLRLSVGCHVVLVDGSPLLNPSQVSTLIDANTSNGACFRESIAAFALRATTGRHDPAQIEAEAISQIRKIQTAGIQVTHLDTHKHTHLFPAVLKALVRAARACGVPALRNPFAPLRSLVLSQLEFRLQLWKRHLQVLALRSWAGNFRRVMQDEGLITPDGTFGVVATGGLDAPMFQRIMESIPDGTWEFVCHPGYDDADLATIKTRLRQSRVEELKVLTSAAAREALAQSGLQLISYAELVRASPATP